MHDIAASIVTYRSPLEEVKAAVDSFYATPLDVQLTVVDNASGAAYLAALKGALGDKVRILEAEKNGGFGYGHNKAIISTPPCKYYLVLNPDVVIHPGALETLVTYLDIHPDVGLATPKALYEDGTLQPLNKRAPNVLDLFLRRFLPELFQRVPMIQKRMERYCMLDEGYDHPYEVPFVSGCCMLFRKSVLDRVGGFDERFFMYLEDADITERTRAFAKTVYVPDAVITHRWRRGSHHSLKLFAVMLHSIWVYFNKWGWKFW